MKIICKNIIFFVVVFFAFAGCVQKEKPQVLAESITEKNIESKNVSAENTAVIKENSDISNESFVFPEKQEYNYNNGNGTIIEQKIENGKQITVRKHESRFELFSADPNEGLSRANGIDILVLLDKPQKNANILFTIPQYPVKTWVNTLLFRYEKKLTDNENRNSSWLYVKTDNGETGWLCVGDISDPYKDGRWSIEEIITVKDKIWIVRKLGEYRYVYEVLNVSDKPGTDNTEVLFKLIPRENNQQLNVLVLAMTEEKDTIDGETDYWLKIKDEQNRIGWIFGGYTDVARGGPNYHTPDASIEFEYDFP